MKKIAELEKIIAEQSERIVQLEKRLGKNSRNSSKPLSSDGLLKPPRTYSLLEKSTHKSGDQPGHKGETLKVAEHPDKIEYHPLTQFPSCIASLISVKATGLLKWQAFDILQPKLEITEHQAEIKTCQGCQRRVTATFLPVYDELKGFENRVLSKIKIAPVKHLYETGLRIAGRPNG